MIHLSSIVTHCEILGVDKNLYKEPLYTLPLVPLQGFKSPFWKIPVNGLQLKYNNITQPIKQFTFSSGAHGKIDSSSPIITLPSSTSDAINAALGATFDSKRNLYIIDCANISALPSLVIQFTVGVDAQIFPDQFIYQLDGGSTCYTAIGAGTDAQNVYLGGPFFRSFYLVYHYTGLSVNIAESSQGQSGKLIARK